MILDWQLHPLIVLPDTVHRLNRQYSSHQLHHQTEWPISILYSLLRLSPFGALLYPIPIVIVLQLDFEMQSLHFVGQSYLPMFLIDCNNP